MNLKHTATFATALLAFALVTLAADDHEAYKVDVSKLPPASTRKDVTYEKDIKPLIENSCLKCHSGNRPKGRLKMDSLENVLKGGESGKAIIAGDSAASPVVGYVSDLVFDMEMPPMPKRKEFPALTKEQIGLLRAWIDSGAK